jgi:ABC-type uncharacterized transport system YnjBCD ATPase subunit
MVCDGVHHLSVTSAPRDRLAGADMARICFNCVGLSSSRQRIRDALRRLGVALREATRPWLWAVR